MSEINTIALADHLGRLLSQGLLNNGMPMSALLGDVAVQFGATPSRSAIKQALVIFNKRNGVQLTWEENRYNPTNPMLVSSVKVEPAPLAPVQLEEDEGDQETLNDDKSIHLFAVNPDLNKTEQELIAVILRWVCEGRSSYFTSGELYRAVGKPSSRCSPWWNRLLRERLSDKVLTVINVGTSMGVGRGARVRRFELCSDALSALLAAGLVTPVNCYDNPVQMIDWPQWLTLSEYLLLGSIARRWRLGALGASFSRGDVLAWPECVAVEEHHWSQLMLKLHRQGVGVVLEGAVLQARWRVSAPDQFNRLLTEIGL